MSIEFPCTQCGKLLRTADETAGRLAKCPACGSVMSVPERAGTSPVGRMAGGPSPLGHVSSVDEAGDSLNPYQAPPEHEPASPFVSTTPPIQQVQAPAICLIVMSALGLVTCIGFAALYAVLLAVMMNDPKFGNQNRPEDVLVGFGMIIGSGLVGAALAALTLYGGIKMKNLRSYGLAMTAAVLMVIPCFSPCGVLGIPFGIWAIVVLARPEVKAAFR